MKLVQSVWRQKFVIKGLHCLNRILHVAGGTKRATKINVKSNIIVIIVKWCTTAVVVVAFFVLLFFFPIMLPFWNTPGRNQVNNLSNGVITVLFHCIRIVSTYLVHHGYCATAEAFAKSTGQSFPEEIASIKNRQSESLIIRVVIIIWLFALKRFEQNILPC